MNERRRNVLAALAEHLVPEGGGMPSTRDVALAQTGLDRVLAALPELEAPLARALDRVDGVDPVDALAALGEDAATLQLVVAGAYLTEPAVMSRLGYHGRAAAPVPDDLDDEVLELLAEALERAAERSSLPRGTSPPVMDNARMGN